MLFYLKVSAKFKYTLILPPHRVNLRAFLILLPYLLLKFIELSLNFKKLKRRLLSHCKTLSSSFNSKFNKLKTSIISLSSQIVNLKTENASLRNDPTTLNKSLIYSLMKRQCPLLSRINYRSCYTLWKGKMFMGSFGIFCHFACW